MLAAFKLNPGEVRDLGDIRLPAEDDPRATSESADSQSPSENGEGSTVVTGQVLTPTGQPAANAAVDVVGRLNDVYSDPTLFGHATSDDEGRFQISMPAVSTANLLEAFVVASGDGFGMGWSPLNLSARRPDVAIRLLRERPIRGRLVDLEGQPAKGLKVHLTNVGVPTTAERTDWALWMHDPVVGLSAWPAPAVTDDEGRFVLRGVGAGGHAHLQVRDEPFAREAIHVKPDQRDPVSVALAPAQVVAGTVVSEETGEPISNARMTVTVGFDRENKHRGTAISGTTDEAGHFWMNPYPGNAYHVMAFPPSGRSELNQLHEFKWPTGDRTRQLELKLPQGVLVRGRITELGTGQPVAGAGIEFHPRATDNPNLRDDVVTGWQARVWSGADGNFTMSVLPGPGHLLVNGPTSHYVFHEIGSTTISTGDPGGVRTYAHAIVPLDIAAETRAHAVQAAELQRGITVRGRLVDPAGRPVKEAKLLWRYPHVASEHEFRGFGTVVRDGVFELHGLAENRSYSVVFLDGEQKLGAAVEITADPSRREPLTVRLQPCGSAVGRFLNAGGEPLAEFPPSLYIVMTPGPNPLSDSTEGALSADETLLANLDRTNYSNPPKTDQDGRCQFPALVPGADYRFAIWEDDQLKVGKTFQVRSGETTDLGEIRLDLKPEDSTVSVEPGETKDLGDVRFTSESTPAQPRPADTTDRRPGSPTSLTTVKDRVVGPDGTSIAEADKPFHFKARVLDPDGQPVEGVRVFFVTLWQRTGPVEIGRSGEDGRWSVEVGPSSALYSSLVAHGGTLIAVADGFGPATLSPYKSETTGELFLVQQRGMPSATPESTKQGLERLMKRIETDPPTFQLARDDVPITGRVVDIQGQPVVGATIRVASISGSREGGLDAWEEALRTQQPRRSGLSRIAGEDVAGNLPRFVAPVTTDENGEFILKGIGRERLVGLRVSGPRIETSEIVARTRVGDPIEVPTEPRSPASKKRVYHPASFVHAAGPSEAVIGTVVDAKSKQPLADVTIQSYHLAGRTLSGWSQRIVRTKTDAEGRYRLEGLPIGENEILVLSPIDEPYMLSKQAAITEAGSGPLQVDFELTRGVWIQGRAFDLDSGEPIRTGRVDYFALRSNPHAQQVQGFNGAHIANRYRLQPDGTYRIPSLPGPGFVGVWAGGLDKYQRGTGADEIEGKDERLGIFMTYPSYAHPDNFHLLQAIDPDVEAQAIELDFPLGSGRVLEVTALDPDGRTLSGCGYTGKLESASWRRARGETLKIYGYKPEKPRRVQVVHKRQKLAGFLLIEGEEPSELTVELQPWSEVKGRILDVDGVPQPGVEITSIYEHVQSRSDVAVLPNNSDSSNGAYYADDEARFHIVGLPAGYKFGMDVTEFRKDGDRFGIGRLSPNVELKPGEVHDVGDLRLFYRSRR